MTAQEMGGGNRRFEGPRLRVRNKSSMRSSFMPSQNQRLAKVCIFEQTGLERSGKLFKYWSLTKNDE